jgi:hypothetical protein
VTDARPFQLVKAMPRLATDSNGGGVTHHFYTCMQLY